MGYDGFAGLQSPILKFIPKETVELLLERVGASDGDIVFFGADKRKTVNDAMGALRQKLAEEDKPDQAAKAEQAACDL